MEPELSDKSTPGVRKVIVSDIVQNSSVEAQEDPDFNVAVQTRPQMRPKQIIFHKTPGASSLSERQGTIFGLIKERGASSVGDLTKLLGVSLSEKTIQRDLNAMAEAGILKREGEKRWRRYFL